MYKRNIVVAASVIAVLLFAAVQGASAQQDDEGNISGGSVDNLVGQVEISGNVTVNGDVGPDAQVTGTGNLNVEGSVRGSIDIDGDINISRSITSGASVKTSGNVTIDGRISGTLEAGGNVTVGEGVEAGANLTLTTPGTELTVEGGISGGTVEVNASDATVDVNGGMGAGTIEVPGKNCEVNIGGNVESDASVVGGASVKVGRNISGKIEVSGSVSISGSVDRGATVRTRNTVDLNETLSGTVEAGGDVSVGENVAAGGKLTLETPGTILSVQGSINGGVTVTEKARVEVGQVGPENPVSVDVESSPQTGVTVSVKNAVSNVSIFMDDLGGRPEDIGKAPSGKTFNYIQIDVENIAEVDIEEGSISFKVEKSELEREDVGLKEVRLLRYHDDEWTALITEMADENATHAFFEATTPGFSTFAINGEEVKVGPGEESPGGEKGPPGFVKNIFDRVRNFLSGLFSKLPVPDFVKDFFGA